MLETLDGIFQGFIGLGGPAMMFIVLTLLALAFRVRLPKALEGGFRMAIALMGMISVINLLSSAFAPLSRSSCNRPVSSCPSPILVGPLWP